ncbi:MAG TPA: transketolase C-terminal domain-containing protein, partial [Treponemataceae bacterium]|nr:transketolase C-terminal domain-containing protein [Treponemataceae bacterium]
DEDFLVSCASGYRAVLFVEDGSETGGIASDLASIVRERLPHVLAASMAFPDIFYPQGSRQEILSFAGLSAVHIYDEALKLRSYIAAGQSR